MAIEDTSIGEAKAQFETNFFGTFRVCRAILPRMRARQRLAILVHRLLPAALFERIIASNYGL